MNGIIQLQDQEEQEEGEGRKLWRWGCQSRPVQSQARTSKLMLDVDCGMWKQGKVCQRANNTALRKVFCKYIVQGPGLGRGQQGDLDNVTSILGLPGYEVLSHNERRLCTSLRLHPSLYISYKTCLLRDHLQKKKGQSPKPVSLVPTTFLQIVSSYVTTHF